MSTSNTFANYDSHPAFCDAKGLLLWHSHETPVSTMLMTLYADKVPNLGLVETIDTEKVSSNYQMALILLTVGSIVMCPESPQ